MKLLIKKGKHRPSNRSIPFAIYFNKKEWAATYVFKPSCRYTLPGADMDDINKLGGLSFSIDPHKNSCRFGWRYNPTSDRIEILRYSYNNGNREFSTLASVNINTEVKVSMFKTRTDFSEVVEMYVLCRGVTTKNHFYNINWKGGVSYLLGLFFGGNNPAPNDIEIQKNEKPYY